MPRGVSRTGWHTPTAKKRRGVTARPGYFVSRRWRGRLLRDGDAGPRGGSRATTSRAPGLGRRPRPARRVLRLRDLHGGAVRPRPRRLAPPGARGTGRGGRGGRGPARGCAPVAAPQDAAGGGRAGRDRGRAAPRAGAGNVLRRGPGPGPRFPRLLPFDLRGRLTPRDLWRRAPGCGRLAPARPGGARTRSLVRASSVRSGLPCRPGRGGLSRATAGVGMAPRRRRRGRAGPDVADVVGRAVSARALPGAAGSRPGPGPGRSRCRVARRARPLALAARGARVAGRSE
jgi:hypothetical protein